MGRLGTKYENEHQRQIQNERRRLTAEEKAEGFAMRQGMLLGEEFDDLKDPNCRVRFCLLTSVIELKTYCEGRVIRRTLNSVRHDGKQINEDLPPYKTIVIGCRLSEGELQALKIKVGELMKS